MNKNGTENLSETTVKNPAENLSESTAESTAKNPAENLSTAAAENPAENLSTAAAKTSAKNLSESAAESAAQNLPQNRLQKPATDGEGRRRELLTFSAVTLFYEHICALRGVTLSVCEGETVALIGANGAGKSSILRAITGLCKIRQGEIRYDGKRIDNRRADEIVAMGVSMAPEGRRVFPYMSVKDNLLMGAFSRSDKGGIAADLEKILHRFPRLKERFGQSASTMSGGEQQMLVIGRALMSRPKLLLLDEPSLGIAPKLVQTIAHSIVAINREDKVSVLLVEQNSRMALKISHRAYAISLGEVAMEGESAQLRNDERVKRLYLSGGVE